MKISYSPWPPSQRFIMKFYQGSASPDPVWLESGDSIQWNHSILNDCWKRNFKSTVLQKCSSYFRSIYITTLKIRNHSFSLWLFFTWQENRDPRWLPKSKNSPIQGSFFPWEVLKLLNTAWWTSGTLLYVLQSGIDLPCSPQTLPNYYFTVEENRDTTKWHIFLRNFGRQPFPTRRLQWPPPVSPRGDNMYQCFLAGIHQDQINDYSFLVFIGKKKIWYTVSWVSVGLSCHLFCNSEWHGSSLT